jgi:hypothetical protein
MAIESKMTIEDYMKKASGRYKVVRQDLKPQKETQAAPSDFNGILSAFKKPSRQVEPKTTKGLSVADYRMRPVASGNQPSRRFAADAQTTYPDLSRGMTAYKEASEYLLGSETPNTQPSISPETGDNDRPPNTSHLHGIIAYKETSEYLLGFETPNTQASISPGTGTNDRAQNASQPSLSNSKKKIFQTPAKGLSQTRSSRNSHTIEKAINDAAAQYQLSPKLIKGVIMAESNYDVNAVSPAGAQGLMQLMPGTAKELGVENPFDIRQNIDGGVRYLKKMMDMFDGNVRQALSAYNAGPGTVKRYNGNVPYSETRQYVERVIDQIKTAV